MESIMHEVTNCSNCPYANYWEFAGMHCENPLTDSMPAEDLVIEKEVDSETIPAWCGLLQYDSLVTLKK